MIAHTPGRRPPTIRIGTAPRLSPVSRPDSLLALADGSLWLGWSGGHGASIAGAVELHGDRVSLDGRSAITLRMSDVPAFLDTLDRASADGLAVRGCVTARGATTPVHEAVARAVARGEIGRP